MNFAEMLAVVGTEPVFESGLLLAGARDPRDVRRQLVRWTSAGRIVQLRRGLYALAPPWRKVTPHPFVVSNRMVRGSVISLQSALAFHGWIPDQPAAVTAVTARRPGRWDTPLGRFVFHHVAPGRLWGYRELEVARGQRAMVAAPEKALLDLVHLVPGGDDPDFLRELRLQDLDGLDAGALARMADRAASPKLRRAVRRIASLAREEAEAYAPL